MSEKKENWKDGLYSDRVREKLVEFAESGWESIPVDEREKWFTRFKFWGLPPAHRAGELLHDAADQLRWHVGLKSGYGDNRGTVREDIAHHPEYDIEDARGMSDAEIEAVIHDHDGVIEFENMEHDDVLLERAGS